MTIAYIIGYHMRMTSTDMTHRTALGRKPRYGEATVQRSVYYPPILLKRLQQEAAWRGARAGNPDKGKVSDLVVEILAAHFGVDLTAQEDSNGR